MHADPRTESDDEWAARVTRAARSGSSEALAEIYDRCADDVVAAIERITRRDESFALDCLQEMFMRLAANPPVVDAHAALFAWMRLTALNIARNAIVAETRRRRREGRAARGEVQIEAGIDGGAMESILHQLDEDQRTLLRLRHADGMRIRAIAHALGATPQAVESAIRRAMSSLRERVAP